MSTPSNQVFETRLFGPLARAVGPAVLGEELLTWPEVLREVDDLARQLKERGLEERMRIGICLDQSVSYVISLLAVLKSGSSALMLSPSWTRPEVDRCVDLIEPSFLLTHGPVPGSAEPRAVHATGRSDLYLLDYRGEETEPSAPEDAVIIFTSGTSGMPKGVVLSGQGLFANVSAVREYLGVEAADASPLFTPTCYAYAVSQVLVQTLGQAAICPIKNGLKYPILVLEAIAKFKLRGMSANPTSFKVLLKTGLEEGLDLSSLRYAMGGGQFLAREVVDAMMARFASAQVVNQYGCTENSPRICYRWIGAEEQPLPGRSLPVGKAVRGTELMVAEEGAIPSPQGEPGQILVRGTSLMSRYWKMPEATQARFIDGWFQTGDLGMLDQDGNLIIIGRLSDSINVGNEKVHPGELEGHIQDLPSIQEAAVFGVEDPLYGESVEAAVVPADGVALDADTAAREIRRHLKELVSAYKIPRRIHVCQGLPRNLYGKIDRKRLPEWVAGGRRPGSPADRA